jgi:hypothetical protein
MWIDPLLDMQLEYITAVYHYTTNFMVIKDLEDWKNKDPLFPEDALIWLTDGSGQGLAYVVKDQTDTLVSLWANTPLLLKPKYMPLFNVHMHIQAQMR